MKGQRVAAFGLVLLFGFAAPGAAVVYVDCNAPGPEHDGLTWDTAYLTIQQGVNLATPNGEVWVADGTYVENVVMGQDVAIYGGFLGAEPGGYETEREQRNFVNNVATIDGHQSGSCVEIWLSLGGSTVDGFTITNGSGSGDQYMRCGGGIFVCGGGYGSVAIANNTITANSACGYYSGYGGGIYVIGAQGSVAIADNTITVNLAYASYYGGFGGGICCEDSSDISLAITNNVIAGNSSGWGPGGGLCLRGVGSAVVVCCNVVRGNTSRFGGGMECGDCSPTIANNIIADNSADEYGGGILCEWATPTLSHNDVWNNSPDDYYGCEPGEGDISADPRLVDPDAGDWHLQPWSPCVDAGDNNAPGLPEYDFEGDPRILDGDGDDIAVVDIGADEFRPQGLWLALVDQNAPGPEHDGLTWDTAFVTIEEGIKAASPNGEVWVADGVYVENVFLAPGVAIYGGFLGAEPGGYETERDQRDFQNNITTIDGNELGSCVTMAVRATIDGFTVTNGTGTWVGDYGYGGGIYCIDIGASGAIANNTITANRVRGTYKKGAWGGGIYCSLSSPAITNNVISGNGIGVGYAASYGAGVCCDNSSPTIVQNVIAGNSAGSSAGDCGGGICCIGSSSPAITGNTISGNQAWAGGQGNGGGIYCSAGSSPVIADNTVHANLARGSGPAYGGGIYCAGSATVTNNSILQNTAYGGMAAFGGGLCGGSPVLTNNIIARNSVLGGYQAGGGGVSCGGAAVLSNNTIRGNSVADQRPGYVSGGGGVYCGGGSPTAANNIVTENSSSEYAGGIQCDEDSFPLLSHNDVWANSPDNYYGCEPGEGDISEDPMLVDPEGGDYHLQPWSPCIDAGDNNAPGLPEYDFEGDPRILYGVVDIGADEHAFSVLTAIAVDQHAPGPVHDGLTWHTAFLTIQEGVAAGTPSGEVWVADGTYVENVVMGQGVQLYGGFLGAEPGGYETSLDQRDFAAHVTTIDGNQSGSCVWMAVDARVDGFTVTNGTGTPVGDLWLGGGFYCEELGETGAIVNNTITENSAMDYAGDRGYGGGVYCQQSSPMVTNNAITHNGAGWHGGGICCFGSSPTVAENTISGNWSSCYGGGIYCARYSSPTVTDNAIISNHTSYFGGAICCYDRSSPTLTRNTIARNHVWAEGGGIACVHGCSPTLTSNTITGNSVDHDCGGGIYCREGCSPTLTSNTITGNSAPKGRGLACYSIHEPSDVEITNCILWNGGDEVWNEGGSTITITYSDVYGGWAGEGNIDADPLFIDPEKGNWHLSFFSPCIDAGTNYAPGLPETDWEGEPRVHDGDGDEEEPGVYATADMGADEFVPLLAVAPDPQPECQGPLFGLPPSGYPGWVWFSIPIDPDSCCGYGDCYDPETLLGFSCSGRLWRWDKYGKYSEVYQLRFSRWDLAVGESYLLRLWTEVSNPWYLGVSPYCPRTFEFKLGRMGWTWIGMPGLAELGGGDFMSSVRVKYPSDDTGLYRTARQDRAATPDNWLNWGWAFYDTYLQGPRTFTPYAPFGNRTCYPWVGYRVWVKVGSAVDESDPDQVTLIWPKAE